MRPSRRQAKQLRSIQFLCGFNKHAEGSVLVEFGDTRVLCTASIERGVPTFLKGKGEGWLTAEYGMLPRSTHQRSPREANRGKQGGRTLEIQRLIGRSLRTVIDLKILGENTITIDCDVLQADGGTRTASITGGYVALALAVQKLLSTQQLKKNPLHSQIAAISVGLYQGVPILDLDYAEDSIADTDMNVVMNQAGEYVEIQGTAEAQAFTADQLQAMLKLADQGIRQLLTYQQQALAAIL
ncbi:MAG: hypothetical protein RL637_1070 [Pseudomonadota bacterium]|jgi:ribonuclease PH